MQKNALVLAGGGARGAYQIGVWQALRELNFPIHVVTGTSVGALNAALVAQDDFEIAVTMWKKLNNSMILSVDVDESLSLKQKQGALITKFIRDYAKKGGMDAYPLKQLLDEYCIEQKIRESKIACGIVAFEKKTLRPLETYISDLPNGTINDYLLASSSLFPAIKSHEIDGTEYIDGGYYDNLPVSLALQRGVDFVIAVDLEAIGVVRHKSLAKARELLTIKSYWDLGPLLLFENKTILRNIRLGYLDTMKGFHAFDGMAYTFIKGELSDYVRTNKQLLAVFNEALGISFLRGAANSDVKNSLFHLQINAYLKRKYGKEQHPNYISFLLACAEAAGEIFGLSPEIIYTRSIFNENLSQRLQECVFQSDKPIEVEPISKLKATLALLDRKNRAIHLGVLFKKAQNGGKKPDLTALSLVLPEEMLAAYYLSLLP